MCELENPHSRIRGLRLNESLRLGLIHAVQMLAGFFIFVTRYPDWASRVISDQTSSARVGLAEFLHIGKIQGGSLIRYLVIVLHDLRIKLMEARAKGQGRNAFLGERDIIRTIEQALFRSRVADNLEAKRRKTGFKQNSWKW